MTRRSHDLVFESHDRAGNTHHTEHDTGCDAQQPVKLIDGPFHYGLGAAQEKLSAAEAGPPL